MLKKVINFITFIDQPIKKKLMLFSLGVLFWFVVMFIISAAANMNINRRTYAIVNHMIPQDRVMQEITKNTETANLALYILAGVLLTATGLLIVFTISI